MRGPALAALAALALGGCGRASDAPSTPSATPRIVSLSPSATEIVSALGAVPSLVGVDSYSTYPPEVKDLPKVGDYLHPNLEVIVQLRPTIVIADDVHETVAAALRDQHIATIACPVHTITDVERCLVQVGAAIGRDHEAEASVAAMAASIARWRHPAPRRVRVLAIIDRSPGATPGELTGIVAAAPGSYVDELLAILGADNVMRASPTPYPKLSMEEILRAQPDVVLDLSYAARTSVAPWDGVAIPAVANHRVVAIDDSTVLAPSPRVQVALARLSAAVYGP